jgi:SOS-response transcriptional repressor LexA
MNRNTLIGFSLIALVLIAFSYWNSPSQAEIEAYQHEQDSIAAVMEAQKAQRAVQKAANIQQAVAAVDSAALFYPSLTDSLAGVNKLITLKNDSLELAFAGAVKAGFPSPAEEVREKLDLVKLLVQHSASTFFFRIDGISMVDADMDEGDIIIVDRAVEPYNNCKAVCFIDGEYTVKRVEIHEGGAFLMPCNEKNTKYKPIPVGPDNDFLIWGVVTWVIKKV